MRIVQICNHFFYGDGVSNCIKALSLYFNKVLIENIIAVRLTDEYTDRSGLVLFDKVRELKFRSDDIVLYHFHSGCPLNDDVGRMVNKKILVYQNVTPPHFFWKVDTGSVTSCLDGQADAQKTRDLYLKALVMSDYNARDLIQYGWSKNDIYKIPLLNKEYEEFDECEIDWWDDNCVNFLFVGRIAPNKRIEDLIEFSNYYEKNVNSKCRLILVGSKPYKNYYDALMEYVNELDCHSVHFASFLSNEEVKSCYRKADLFLCMSEHEGFCIPLIEAMRAKLPVVAYSSSAVTETVGDAGVLFHKKDYPEIAKVVQRLINDNNYRKKIIEKQLLHANRMNIDANRDAIYSLISEVNAISDFTYKTQYIHIGIDCRKIESKGTECFVIYGAGNGGITLYSDIKKRFNVVAFCDNGVDEKELELPIYRHNECVSKFKDAIYIISIQNRQTEIVASLIKSGIEVNCIYIYDMEKNTIE